MANDAIKFLADMRSTQKGLRATTFAALAVCALVSVAAVFLAMRYVERGKSEIFILDEGAAIEARRAENGEQRDLEVTDHMRRFHELFFNIAPNLTTINQSVARAMELADESAYRYFTDLKEQNYFSTLIRDNITQQIVVDSVKVDVVSYPYRATAWSSLYVLRESNITLYTMRTQCEMTNVQRSVKNPHGLMIHRFHASKPEFVETRVRN